MKKLPLLMSAIAAVAILWGCGTPPVAEDPSTGMLGRPAGVSAGIMVLDQPGYEVPTWSPLYPDGTLRMARRGIRPPENSIADKISFVQDGGNVLINIDPDESVDIYGAGEYAGPLRLNGTHVIFRNTDNNSYRKKEYGLYQSYPWIMGLNPDGSAFGVLVDCTYPGRVDVAEGGQVLFTFQGAPMPRVIVIEKPHPAEVVTALSEIIGTIELPPLWAMGYHQSRYSYNTPKEALRIADEFRSRKIPADAIWFDIDYMEGYRIFTFNQRAFPNPKRLNQQLHDQNFKTVWMIDPGVKKEKGYWVYDEGARNDAWVKRAGTDSDFTGHVWPGECVWPDFTRPETCEWWRGLYRNFMSLGIDGVWNDMNEPASWAPAGSKLDMEKEWRKAWHRGGGPLPPGSHDQYRNVYGFLMVKTSREGILRSRPNERPFVLTRSNFIGGQRYAATWTGDNVSSENHMKLSIPMALAMGLSGQPLSGPDVPGFNGRATPEIAARWFALAPFYPFSRGHANKNSNAKEPWAFGKDVETSARTALERRYRLMPYLYTITEEAARTGMPIMRPLFFINPVKRAYRTEQEAFMFGGDLLVIPEWAQHRKFLPDWPTVSIALGDRTDPRQAEVRIRPGSIVPLTRNTPQHTDECDFTDLELLVAPDADGHAEGYLYEDDMRSFNYRNGAFRRTKFTAEVKNGKLMNLVVERIDGRMAPSPVTIDNAVTTVIVK